MIALTRACDVHTTIERSSLRRCRRCPGKQTRDHAAAGMVGAERRIRARPPVDPLQGLFRDF
jgi:hypothetical protein